MSNLSTETVKALSITWSRSGSIADSAILGLCIFSVANPVIAEVATFFLPGTIAGMNVMQWFQGLCFPLILITLPGVPKGCVALSRPFSRLLWAYVISLGLFHLRLLTTGRIPADMVNIERMVYFKIIFALLLLYYASCLAQSYESARRLLQAILLGALITAGWILMCYCSGIGGAHYASDGIRATAGSVGISGKGIAGFLLPAAAGAMFLALRESSYRWAIGASLMVMAVFVTFDRSAQVAFVVSLSWVAVWWLALARPKPRAKTVLLALGIICLLGAIYYAHHGSEELTARWTRDFDRGEIGSGRGTFYAAAWSWLWAESSLADFIFGMGFGNIYDLMHVASGIFRHTHSDLFDMLLIGGMVGLMLFLLLFYTVASLGRGVPRGSVESATLGTLLISFGVMSLLTGLLMFPHTVYAFGAQCICIRVLATQERGAPAVPLREYPCRCARIDSHDSKRPNAKDSWSPVSSRTRDHDASTPYWPA